MSFEAAVEAIIKKNEKMIITSGKVTEVRDESIDVEREGMPSLLEVRFNSVLNAVQNEFKIVPKKGSIVLCGIIESNISEAILISCSEVEKLKIKVDQLEFECAGDGIKISNNGESFLTALNDMFDELNKILIIQGNTLNVSKMKAIKTRFNKILK